MKYHTLIALFFTAAFAGFLSFTFAARALAQTPATTIVETIELPRVDLTRQNKQTLGPLERLLNEQNIDPVWPFNPMKLAIRESVKVGVPANTIVLLLLLPLVAAFIAAARHLIGLRGFGIFLPAALSVVFLSTGPFVGIVLFLVIIVVSTLTRIVLRRLKIKLQYLPRMSLMLWFVVTGVLGVLFTAPYAGRVDITNVSIFSILILVLLAEDFSKVQIGKSARTAVALTTETLILALISFTFLTYQPLQVFALLNPEMVMLSVFVFNYLIGKYIGLRFVEFWRFRKLISG